MTALPNRDRRTERREATRREILDIAWSIAREDGLPALTLRAVADRMGMRPPSLYSHFASKNAIYDAMFAESWRAAGEVLDASKMPDDGRRALLSRAETFFDFATSDLARYQLMNQRTIPHFAPSEEAYQHSVAVYQQFRDAMRARGIRSQGALDLWTAMLGGCVDQQLANDPGGTRWRRQLPRLVDMFCDEVGIPGPRLRRNR